ncbi:MAG: Tumor necrosis factor, alpha-induced protein 2 [Marteilia pararefringens]
MENMYKSIKTMNIRLTQIYAESLNVTLIPLFKLLFTQEWAGEKNFVDKVFSMVDDDASEMRYLETTNLSIMLENLYIHIISCYYARFFSLKDKIKSRDMRYSYSNKAISEMDAITESADLEGDAKNYITFIGKSFKCFMNILQINDINMLYIELQDSEKYLCVFPPDFIEHALSIKGDLSNNEIKECVRVLRYDKSDEKINAFVNLIKKNM